MSPPPLTAEERARLRKTWPVEARPLGSEEEATVEALDASAAWKAVLELTWEAYRTAGLLSERLPRHQWPSRLFRPGEPRPDSHGL